MGLLKQLFGWGQMSSDDFLKRGVAHLKKREYDRAIADFSEAIQLDPKNCKAFLGRALAYRSAGDDSQAEKDELRSKELTGNDQIDKANSPTILNLMKASSFGTVASYEGDYDRAIADFTEVIQASQSWSLPQGHSPTNPAVFFNRGQAYLQKGEYDNAIADFTESIRLGPRDGDAIQAFLNRAEAHLLKANVKETIADCCEVIRLDPNNQLAYLIRGTVFDHNGEYDKAIDDCTRAILLNPGCFAAYIIRGHSYLDLKDYKAAIGDYAEAIRLDPSCADTYRSRAEAYRALGNEVNAADDFRTAQELSAGRS